MSQWIAFVARGLWLCLLASVSLARASVRTPVAAYGLKHAWGLVCLPQGRSELAARSQVGLLDRIALDKPFGGTAAGEHELMGELGMRDCDVLRRSDGWLHALTDCAKGHLLRLQPAERLPKP
jgi:glucose/arabinose dehydrogenase